jgi:type I restriction enzyme M protein
MTPQELKFIDTLREFGGSAGNKTLRAALGWQEATYDRVKNALLDGGRIVPGRGRGGSVGLARKAGKASHSAERSASRAASVKVPKTARGAKSVMPDMAALRRGGPVRKSDLYASLWASCDELRGGMDASQYKDYVLTLLFVKYVSDKYAGKRYAPVKVPEGASFADMVTLKGKSDIGDRLNKQVIGPLFSANRLPEPPDFNDAAKLGSGKELVQRLTNLIAIFQNPALDFSKNRADGDDLLGDAYEYLMRHFATESGKSKGQFYTPAEVSRVIAQVIGIRDARTTAATTAYDPTCGSSSLLLKVADEARAKITLFGQEKDVATAVLARMNVILHDFATAEIEQGNTLTNPKFLDHGKLRRFDYVVANPPFSDKRWSTGFDPDPEHDPHGRFEGFGVPPGKQGDYAYLLHILASMKSDGVGACILPHGVLFRGNAEVAIRRNLIRRGLIKGIIGLPANLFYGTGIPACIVVLDKREAAGRRGIFMIDASAGFQKDGPKNRLRERDLHRIVDAFRAGRDVTGYARMVPLAEIKKNDFNLNLPRYIDGRACEDRQDIAAHLLSGIPEADVDALAEYWDACPGLRAALFRPLRPGYLQLVPEMAQIRSVIQQYPRFVAHVDRLAARFETWRQAQAPVLKALQPGFHPRDLIHALGEGLLAHYRGQPLTDAYAVYQHLLDYWAHTMQDDAWSIAADGWIAQPYRVVEEKKNKDGEVTKIVDKGWACDLVPKSLVVARFFAVEQAALDAMDLELDALDVQIAELEEEHGGDEGVFVDFDKVNARAVRERLEEIDGDDDSDDERSVLLRWQQLDRERAALKKQRREVDAALDAAALAKYAELAEADIQALVVDDKWLAQLQRAIATETARSGQQLTARVRELAERYAAPLPRLAAEVEALQAKVDGHLKRMGFAWA